MGHTPGPWNFRPIFGGPEGKWYEKTKITSSFGENDICFVKTPFFEHDQDEAALISSAPDLLTALEDLVRLPLDSGCVESALRAITKAKGKDGAK